MAPTCRDLLVTLCARLSVTRLPASPQDEAVAIVSDHYVRETARSGGEEVGEAQGAQRDVGGFGPREGVRGGCGEALGVSMVSSRFMVGCISMNGVS